MLSAGLSKYLAAACAVAAFAAGWYTNGLRAELREKVAEVKNREAEKYADQKAEAENEETRNSETQTDIHYQQGIAVLVEQRNALAVELERLRVAARRPAKPGLPEAGSCPAVVEATTAATDSLLECAAELTAVAEAHDSLSLQVTGLLEIDARNEKLLRGE